MIVLDSSAWLEYFRDGPFATKIEKYLAAPSQVLVPTLVLYEVYRYFCKKVDLKQALQVCAQIQKCKVSLLTQDIAFLAADLSLNHSLATADSIVYASALHHGAELVTLDNDFRNLPSCRLMGKE